MSWNHRVVRRIYPHAHRDDTILYQIHEVYYEDDGYLTIINITEEPVRIIEETVDDLRKTVERLTKCLEQPIIDYETLQEVKQHSPPT
jgi:archaellum component FlaC